MSKQNIFLIFLVLLLLFVHQTILYPYVYTKEAPLIKADKFNIDAGVREYYKGNIGSVFEIPIVVHLGLAKKVELIAIFPYIQLKNKLVREEGIATWGDILVFLKFDIKKFFFKYPLISVNVINQLDLVLGVNSGTGASKETGVGEYFSPYSLGLGDFRIGLLYSQQISDFSIDFDFIYTFAKHTGEDYLPFSDKFWSSKEKIYLFGLVNVMVKFLWPGKYPFAPKGAHEWEQYPHIDDFFNFNTGFKYYFEPDWLFFSYDIFTELNWVNSWSKWCTYPSYLLFTPGIQVYLTETMSIVGGVSFLGAQSVYQTETEKTTELDPKTGEEITTKIEKRVDFYFDHLYFIGIRFLL